MKSSSGAGGRSNSQDPYGRKQTAGKVGRTGKRDLSKGPAQSNPLSTMTGGFGASGATKKALPFFRSVKCENYPL